jgi:hypothetical protein
MRYRIINNRGLDEARELIKERKPLPDLSTRDVVVGGGDLLEESVLVDLANRIRESQGKLAKLKASPEELDRKCFADVHETIPRDELLCADGLFWTRFAIVHLSDVISKRFPGRLGKVNLDNYGLGTRRECWPYKLWVRGRLSHGTGGRDKYALGHLGGVEFWTSHVHRQNFMAVPGVLRAVVQLQYPAKLKGRPFLFEGEENPEKGGYPGIRTLIKRLKENWATVEYLMLDDRSVRSLLVLHGKGLRKPDGKPAKIS